MGGMPLSDRFRPADVDSALLARWLFLLVWVLSAANGLHYLDRGWLPQDLGTLGQSAMRVLGGQWPHRDFEDVYTGGLALLDALGFKALGISAMTLRWVIFAVYLAWIPAVWYLARRLAGPVLAAAATLLAAAWTLPVYAEGMPSWYNLFLATFGTAALFRWVEVRHRRWLFAAGLAGGLSIVIKIVGLYYVAGGLVFLAYAELSSTPEEPAPGGRAGSRAYRTFLVVCALAMAALVVGLVVRAMRVVGLLRFGIPALAPALTLAFWIGVRRGPASADSAGTGRGWRRLAALAIPFLAGVTLPVALFVLPYAVSGALGDLYRGLFVLPTRRFLFAQWEGLWGHGVGVAVALAAVAWIAWGPPRGRTARLLAAACGALVLGGALAASGHVRVYRVLWETLWWLPLWVTLAAAAKVLTTRAPSTRDRQLFALFAVYGLASLIEIPFAAPVYFFFSAPLLVLLALGLAGHSSAPRRAWLLAELAFFLGFTVLRLDPGFIRNLGFQPNHAVENDVLELPRSGGLRVDSADAHDYPELVGLIDALAGGPYIYATPDCPEVYFLSGHLNPTPTLFEFFDPERNTPARILATLDRAGVRVVVINRDPFFSKPVSPELVAGLRKRYPLARAVGRFLVVWKPPAAAPHRPNAP